MCEVWLDETPFEETEPVLLELDSKNEEPVALDALMLEWFVLFPVLLDIISTLEDFCIGSVPLDVWPMEDALLDESVSWSLFEGLFEQAIRAKNASTRILFIP